MMVFTPVCCSNSKHKVRSVHQVQCAPDELYTQQVHIISNVKQCTPCIEYKTTLYNTIYNAKVINIAAKIVAFPTAAITIRTRQY